VPRVADVVGEHGGAEPGGERDAATAGEADETAAERAADPREIPDTFHTIRMPTEGGAVHAADDFRKNASAA
jgi:hypothetical protein